jgi:hypothetical protein
LRSEAELFERFSFSTLSRFLELLVMLEILHSFFVLLCRASGAEGSEIPALAGLGVFLPRVQAIFTGLQFSNHMNLRCVNPLRIEKEEQFSWPSVGYDSLS